MTSTHHLRSLLAATAAAVALTVTATACGDPGGSSDSASTTTTGPAAQQWNPGAGQTSDPDQTPTSTATSLDPAFGDVDMSDPASVARKAMQVWFTWDTTVEHGPGDAVANTAPLLTPEYADAALSTAPVNGPGGQWLVWAAQKAHTTVDVVDTTPAAGGTDAGPSQGAGERTYFEFQVTQTPRNSSGAAIGAPVTTRVAVLVSRVDDTTWGVSFVQPL